MPDFTGPWHGITRTEIDWSPRIEEGLCIGCGLCVTTCGRKVFDYDFDRKKAVTARPIQCMVGCVTCENICPRRAIGFPPVSYVARLIKDHNVLVEAKSKLEELRQAQKDGEQA